MENKKWNNVLIEWVNCLKLCKNINKLDELRDGEFFSNLQKVMTKSRDAQLDTLTFIFDLCEKHYPNYVFDNKKEIHLADLPEMDLKAITSLLMHYSCIYDRKDVLTSPLCHSLSQSTQLIIRNFFQQITKSVTKETMNDIIKSCIDDASEHLTNQWLTVQTTSCKNSPLQDLLKTPVSKFGRLYEKDKIISALKSELETERYEKTDLQEELKLQLEKSKKIEQQLTQKNSEISRLRAEVVVLENRTPPHFQDTDNRELQRRLRSEIQTLEQYIKQIEDEQDEIRKEKDAAKEKLRKTELQSNMWEEKFFETERNFESLTEHSKKQEEELRELQAHCSEITALLEEYRAKPENDSSLYDSVSSTAKVLNETLPGCEEDLACSVVEVQLRESQKQNQELNGEIVQLRDVVHQTEAKLKECGDFNMELTAKITSLENDKEISQKQIQKIQEALNEANETSQDLKLKITSLETKLQESNKALETVEKDKEQLLSKIAKLQFHTEELETKLAEALDNWEDIKKRSQTLEKELVETKAVSQKLQFELADVILENQKLNTALNDLKNKNNTLLVQLNETENNQKMLESHMSEFQEYTKNLASERDTLHVENHALKQEVCDKNAQLISMDQEKSELITRIQNMDEKLNDLDKCNKGLHSEVTSLQKQLKDALGALDSSEKHSQELQDNCMELEKQKSEAEALLEKLKSELNVLTHEKQEMGEEIVEQKRCIKELEQEKHVLEARLTESEDTRQGLCEKNEDLQRHNEFNQKQLSDTLASLEKSKKQIQDFQEAKKSLETQLQASQTHLVTLKSELEQMKRENEKLDSALDEKKLKLNESEKRNQNYQLQIETLQRELQDSKSNLKTSKKDLSDLKQIKSGIETQLKQVEVESAKLRDELRILKCEMGIKDEELAKNKQIFIKLKEDSTERICNLEAENVKLEKQLNETIGSLKTSKKEEEKLRSIKNELELRLEETKNLEKKLKADIEKLNIDLAKSQEENKNNIKKLEILTQESDKLIDDLQRQSNQTLGDLIASQQQNKNLINKFENLEQENGKLIELLQKRLNQISENLSNSHKKNKGLEKKLEDLKQENEKVIEELQERLNQTSNDLSMSHQENKDLLQKLDGVERENGRVIEDLQKRLNQTLSDLELKTSESKQLNEVQAVLETRLDEVEKMKVVLEAIENQLNETCNSYEELKREKSILDKENIEMKELIISTERKLHEAQESVKEFESRNDDIAKKLQSTQESLSMLGKQNNDLITKVQDLEREKEELSGAKEILEEQFVQQKNNLKDTEKVVENLEITLKRTHVLVEEAESEKQKINETLMNERNKSEALFLTLNTKCEGLEEKLSDYVNELEKSNKELGNVEKAKATLETTTRNLKSQLESSENRIKDLENEKESLHLISAQLEVELNQVNNKNEVLQKEIFELKTNSETSVNSLTKEKVELALELEKLSKINEELRHQNNVFENQLFALEKEYTVSKNDKEILDKRLTEMSILSEALKAESEDLRIQYQKSKIELDDTRDLLLRLTSEKENLVTLLQHTKEQNGELEKRIAELTDILELKENRYKELEKQYMEATTKLENEKKSLISENESLQKRIIDIEEDNKASQEKILKQIEETEHLNQELKQVSEERTKMEIKIHADEVVFLEAQNKIKLLEETIQDYEMTISGLKSVVDANLVTLESLKEELSQAKDKETETKSLIYNLLKDNNLIDEEEGQGDFKSFISENFEKILSAKNQEAQFRKDLKAEIEELKAKNMAAMKLNANFQEMVQKLQVLVLEQSEIGTMDALKSGFDQIHAKVNDVLNAKQKLSEELDRLKNDNSELNKKLEDVLVEKEEISKSKTELENNLKEEKEKVESLRKELEIKSQPVKMEKENILGVSTKANKSREEELKKDNMMLKRKLVLTENAKNNLEKVLKQLREEKKKSPTSPSNDILYKKLLQEYIQVKEESEQTMKERDAKIAELTHAVEKLKIRSVPIKEESDIKITQDLHNLREAYGNVISVNSKLELEMVTLRKMIEDRNNELANFNHIKEAYEKLLEENNKVMTEIDTIKYKRMRDKEEFVRLVKKERDESSNREMKKVQDIRNEYEAKLEKMKEKMLKLYREEVNKKVRSIKGGQSETATLMKTVANLRSELFEAEQKIQMLEMEKEIMKTNKKLEEAKTLPLQTVSSFTLDTRHHNVRAATLPRPSITEEITISRRTSISGIPNDMGAHNLQMEDEEDLFNDKYLTDLKEGRCALTDRDSTCRFSELAWRNSMVPPHLKSSYPAEMQFISPNRFKDEDIKASNIEFEDSLCKLLPGEKPRKKDFGTTSYKKPGPPTPSKNGGRLSLQGNEIHPMRDPEVKTPKRSTPSRIKALFTGRNTSVREAVENQNNVTPNRGRRLGIFRRPR